MKLESKELRQLLTRLHESLAVEVKRWIDPSLPEGIAAIARACIALRNNDGGYLVIGFDNASMKPDESQRPADLRKMFHHDVIQGIARKYSSEAFEIEVVFVDLDNKEFPVVVVPSGLRTPVAARADLHGPDPKKRLIAEHAVYVRSLDANNTVSTTTARWQDWPGLVERCMDNREADVARFLSRYTAVSGGKELETVLAGLAERGRSSVAKPEDVLSEGQGRYQDAVAKRALQLPDLGYWEVATVIDGQAETTHKASQAFLNLISSSNPQFTGWPTWVDSRGFRDKSSWPYVLDDAWEALIVGLNGDWSDHLDFWRISPTGHLYLIRALEDDIARSPNAPGPLKALDFALVIWRVTESLAVALRVAKAMSYHAETTTLHFAFRWTRLSGRTLSSWAHPSRFLTSREAYQDAVLSRVSVPLGVSDSVLHQFVATAIAPLYSVFQGFELSAKVFEDIANEVLKHGNK